MSGAGDAKINKTQALPSWNLNCDVHWSSVGQGEKNRKVATYPVLSLHSSGARRVNIYLSHLLTTPAPDPQQIFPLGHTQRKPLLKY